MVSAVAARTARERGILFSAAMVRKILDGSKSQTRRTVKELGGNRGGPVGPHVLWFERGREDATRWCGHDGLGSLGWVRCPYGDSGDRLWVRETWQAIHVSIDPETGYGDDVDFAKEIPKAPGTWWKPVYAATDEQADYDREDRGFPWRPGIHMPRWASRILLEVEEVSVERLHDISEIDARAEGVDGREAYFALWAEINGKASLEANPWVWCIDFRRIA